MPKCQDDSFDDFVVGATFPEESEEKRGRIHNPYASYWEHLDGLTLKQLDDLLQAKKKKRGVAEDAKLPFNEPLPAEDIAHWGGLASWTALEAVALSLGKDPTKADQDALAAALEISPLAKEYGRLRDRVLRAAKAGELPYPMLPAQYIEWTQREKIDLPKDLIAAVTRRCGKIEDWKSIRENNERLSRRVGELEALLSAQLPGGSDAPPDLPLENRNAEVAEWKSEREVILQQRLDLVAELEAVKKENGNLRKASIESAKTNTINTLLKIVWGMATGGYGYSPETLRSAVPGEIANDTAVAGCPVTDDTVRKWLNEAWQLHGESVRSSGC